VLYVLHAFQKAALVVQLKRLITERELTQTAAAKLIEMKQPVPPDRNSAGRMEYFQLASAQPLITVWLQVRVLPVHQ